jgi:molecular chaperone DnaK (HSP70)
MFLGIDLGTSNSVIAGIDGTTLQLFKTADGSDTLPSVIYVDKRGMRLFGNRAYAQAIVSPENVAAGFKRLMGTSTPITLSGAGVSLTPEDCSTAILEQLLAQAHVATGKATMDNVVITIPAAFNQMQSEATLRAAEKAGLKNVSLLQEPIAAAIASLAGSTKSGQFLIYDLGGGTFDLALAQSLNGNVSILAHHGINMLGGRDFDRMMVNEVVRPWLAANFDLPDDFQRDPKYRRLIRVGHMASERAKIDLSSQDEAVIFASDEEMRVADQSGVDMFLDIRITRSEYEALIREPVLQTVSAARMLLEDNGYTHEDIDRVVFIGGPSKTPMVREIVSQELGIAVDLKADPMTTVAIGAAYHAQSKAFQVSGQPAPIVTAQAGSGQGTRAEPAPAAQAATIPAAQAIAVKVLESLHDPHNVLQPLLERGTMLPTSGQQKFTAARALTAADNAYLSFELFQMEYPERPELNLCVGVFRIAGQDLPDGYAINAGDTIIFNWRMSESGILSASAHLPGPDGAPGIDLKAPRFYSPQAGEVSFDHSTGAQFADAMLKLGEEEWGDLAGALGPEAGREIGMLHSRLEEQRELLADSPDDAETIRRASEEARFIRQDIARLAKRHLPAMLQRRLGKLTTSYNRIARQHASPTEQGRFDEHAALTQDIIDTADAYALQDADRHLAHMRDLFFDASWRDTGYVTSWFRRLSEEPYLFPDQDEFKRFLSDGEQMLAAGDMDKFRPLVHRMLSARVMLGASDIASELATVVRA